MLIVWDKLICSLSFRQASRKISSLKWFDFSVSQSYSVITFMYFHTIEPCCTNTLLLQRVFLVTNHTFSLKLSQLIWIVSGANGVFKTGLSELEVNSKQLTQGRKWAWVSLSGKRGVQVNYKICTLMLFVVNRQPRTIGQLILILVWLLRIHR